VLVEGGLSIAAVERLIVESEQDAHDLFDAGSFRWQSARLIVDPDYFPRESY
jgi:hypothetical protein